MRWLFLIWKRLQQRWTEIYKHKNLEPRFKLKISLLFLLFGLFASLLRSFSLSSSLCFTFVSHRFVYGIHYMCIPAQYEIIYTKILQLLLYELIFFLFVFVIFFSLCVRFLKISAEQQEQENQKETYETSVSNVRIGCVRRCDVVVNAY